MNGNEYKSALIESFTGEWLYLEVLSYEVFGSYFNIKINEVRILDAGQRNPPRHAVAAQRDGPVWHNRLSMTIYPRRDLEGE